MTHWKELQPSKTQFQNCARGHPTTTEFISAHSLVLDIQFKVTQDHSNISNSRMCFTVYNFALHNRKLSQSRSNFGFNRGKPTLTVIYRCQTF